MSKPTFARLPTVIKPVHYEIHLRPNITAFSFAGEEVIDLQVSESSSTVVLNAVNIDFREVSVTLENGHSFKATNIDVSEEVETATISFSEAIPVGNAKLIINFTGEISEQMKGWYRAKYTSPDGETRYAASTMFEPTDARRCFPCWDEPAIKATFDLSLTVPKDRVAVSNMPVVSESDVPDFPNLRLVKFDTSPIMSTYLVAIFVGELDYVEATTELGRLVRVYTPLGLKSHADFGLKAAVKSLTFFEKYFDVPYPLPKVDLVPVPDFQSGAMENWGMVTFREDCLMVDPDNTSSSRKQWIAIIIAHELAHQWFGNLVTMEWWTHLWLNEGYASFSEYLCVDSVFPEYEIWTQFVTDTVFAALGLDSMKNSHPIEVPVNSPSEVDEIFDEISYNKGASVIRMLHNYIGDADFRKGMKLYLERHRYKNTFTEDLWEALGEACSKPIRDMMHTWTSQVGFPSIDVQYTREGDNIKLKLKQQRFLSDGSQDDKPLWSIPVDVISATSVKTPCLSVLLDQKEAEYSVEATNGSWIKLNPGQIGFYIVKYPSDLLESFRPAIKDKTLPPIDRLGLVHDLFMLVQAGQATTVDLLNIVSSFIEEDSYVVWNCISGIIGKLSLLLDYTESKELFKKFTLNLMKQVFSKVGWEPTPGESHAQNLLRVVILRKMGLNGDEAVIEEAKRRFEKHLDGSEKIPADIRATVFAIVMSVGGRETYDAMLKLYREASTAEEKNRVGNALGKSRDAAVLRDVIDFAESDEVRKQDSVRMFCSVANSRVGRDIAWGYYKENHAELVKKHPGVFHIGELIQSVTCNFATDELAEEVESFLTANNEHGVEMKVKQAVESIKLNSAWLKRDAAKIQEFLAKQV